MPLTRYPKKNPEEQMRNCCHLGRSVRPIPSRDRFCSSGSLPMISPSSLLSLSLSLYLSTCLSLSLIERTVKCSQRKSRNTERIEGIEDFEGSVHLYEQIPHNYGSKMKSSAEMKTTFSSFASPIHDFTRPFSLFVLVYFPVG